MNKHSTSDQPPLQMLSDRSKKRRNDLSEEDLARLPDLLSHLSVSKRVCQEHSRDQSKSRSMITAATGSISLDTVVGPENRTSIQRPINDSSKRARPTSYVHQRNLPKLEHSREGKHCRNDQPVLEDIAAQSKPLRRRYRIRRVLPYVPGHRPGLVETNGHGLHPVSMLVSYLFALPDNPDLLKAASG